MLHSANNKESSDVMKIIFMNIKNMLRRPLIFMILLIGLSVGSFAQIVYYVSSSAELRMGQSHLIVIE